MFRYRIALGKQKSIVLAILLSYAVLTHLLACVYFAIHRYILRESRRSYILGYGLATFHESTGEHDICNTFIGECYLASIYFMACVITSVGFGEFRVFV
jgi:hypothetical protein